MVLAHRGESPGVVSSPADLDVHPSDHVDEFGHVMKCHCTSFPLCLPRLDNSHRIVAGLETVNIEFVAQDMSTKRVSGDCHSCWADVEVERMLQ